jgi:three-Cys-motif partner protein
MFSEEFFQEQREQSLIKTLIVTNYFEAWATVILRTKLKYLSQDQRMGYIDLFAGPGRYDDGTKSTPLIVLEKIIKNPELANRMVVGFNDKDFSNIEKLKLAVNNLNGIKNLKYSPIYFNEEVCDRFVEEFKNTKMISTFFFVDPFGYKGLSLALISSIIKDWGCDCVFFFNYNRVNRGLNYEGIEQHLISLFGADHLESIRKQVEQTSSPEKREAIILQELCDALKNNGVKYVLPFRFKDSNGTKTSHHLIFISKHFRGYDIMKGIMRKQSSSIIGEAASFEYNPHSTFYKQGSLLDHLSRPTSELQEILVKDYTGRTTTVKNMYEEHSVDKPYVKSNYIDVLKKLFAQGKITVIDPETGKPPRRGTFPDRTKITF